VPLADGEVFAGYRIVRPLGSGGMGEVYLAQHPRLPRRDALKVLRADVSADSDYRARFEREADLASTLWHPHIVGVHDRGEIDGQLWITMDYVDGTDAAHLMQHRYPYGMPLPDVLEIVSGIADALDYAHEQHLLHRDVKPSNILLTESRSGIRRILLADFGIARAAHDTSGLTATNMTVGSVGYAAPEQLMGAPLNGCADQYALACTAFHLISGAPPFVNSNPAVVIGNHLSTPPPKLATPRPDLAALDAVLHKAMAKEPSQRFPSCRAFAAALAEAGAGLSGATDPTQPAMNVTAPHGGQQPNQNAGATTLTSRRAVVALTGVGALLIVGLVAFIGAQLGQPPSAPPATYSPSSTPPASQPSDPEQTVTYTAPPPTITQPGQPPITVTQPAPATQQPQSGDLGLRQPISHPSCNGQGIVILGSVTTPGLYAAGVQRLLEAHPGAFYLRTDQTCPSLRPATAEGNPIYAVFQLGGTTQAQVCAAVDTAGEGSYGKWLDTTTDPDYIIPC
jgi:serine/threonine protein kinase, bacterial